VGVPREKRLTSRGTAGVVHAVESLDAPCLGVLAEAGAWREDDGVVECREGARRIPQGVQP